MKRTLQVNKKQCATCPFRRTGWTEARNLLERRALSEGSPICHSTGSTSLVARSKRTSSTQRICRGARDLQLTVFYRMGIINAPTDEAWDAKQKELRD